MMRIHYNQLQKDNAIVRLDDGGIIWNTSLLAKSEYDTTDCQPIYIICQPTTADERKKCPDSKPYTKIIFISQGTYKLQGTPFTITEQNTPMANFYKYSDEYNISTFYSNMIENPNFAIVLAKKHIVKDRSVRFPSDLQNDVEKRKLCLDEACRVALFKFRRNPNIAVPFFHTENGGKELQWLLPLYFSSKPKEAQLALAVSKVEHAYHAYTVLTLDWSYSYARVFAKLMTQWLKPSDEKPPSAETNVAVTDAPDPLRNRTGSRNANERKSQWDGSTLEQIEGTFLIYHRWRSLLGFGSAGSYDGTSIAEKSSGTTAQST
jgi:Domain of unknown function (DUF3825)